MSLNAWNRGPIWSDVSEHIDLHKLQAAPLRLNWSRMKSIAFRSPSAIRVRLATHSRDSFSKWQNVIKNSSTQLWLILRMVLKVSFSWIVNSAGKRFRKFSPVKAMNLWNSLALSAYPGSNMWSNICWYTCSIPNSALMLYREVPI